MEENKIFDDEVTERLEELSKRWNELEKGIKQFEKIKLQVYTPTINELRYAGRRIVDSLCHLNRHDNEESRKEAFRHLTIAESCCENADHDLTDSICSYFSEKIDFLVEKYEYDVVVKYFSETPKILADLDEAEEIIKTSREARESRTSEYLQLKQGTIPRLVSFKRQLDRSEDLMRISEKKRKRKEWFLIGLAIIGVLVGIIGVVI